MAGGLSFGVDTTELVERWTARLFGEQGTLNDKLTARAA